jgi:hypothetical protein
MPSSNSNPTLRCTTPAGAAEGFTARRAAFRSAGRSAARMRPTWRLPTVRCSRSTSAGDSRAGMTPGAASASAPPACGGCRGTVPAFAGGDWRECERKASRERVPGTWAGRGAGGEGKGTRDAGTAWRPAAGCASRRSSSSLSRRRTADGRGGQPLCTAVRERRNSIAKGLPRSSGILRGPLGRGMRQARGGAETRSGGLGPRWRSSRRTPPPQPPRSPPTPSPEQKHSRWWEVRDPPRTIGSARPCTGSAREVVRRLAA